MNPTRYRTEGTVIRLRSTFHAAHRLPHLPGKCRSLHGHTWRAWADITTPGAEPDDNGIIADFGYIKTALNAITKTHFDHGVLLGVDDGLQHALTCDAYNDHPDEQKVFLFGKSTLTKDLRWPTVENVAIAVHRLLSEALGDSIIVESVTIQETDNNQATYTGSLDP